MALAAYLGRCAVQLSDRVGVGGYISGLYCCGLILSVIAG